MPVSEASWASFFTGNYNVFVDNQQVAVPAALEFNAPGTHNLLRCHIHAASVGWSDTGDCYLALKTMKTPGIPWKHQSVVPGGHMCGTLILPDLTRLNLYLQCWELVFNPNQGWFHGFDSTGKNVVLRFEGWTDYSNSGLTYNSKVWFTSVGTKKRPDANYPWNLP